MEIISISTSRETDFVDITPEVEKVITSSGIKEGVALIYSEHTTGAIVINEKEAGLLEDYLELLRTLVPRGKGYMHNRIDSNAHAHLRALILGNEKLVPVVNFKPALGTWQRIFFVELDGPRRRKIIVKVLKDI